MKCKDRDLEGVIRDTEQQWDQNPYRHLYNETIQSLGVKMENNRKIDELTFIFKIKQRRSS